MKRHNRGLELAEVGSVGEDEIEEFHSFYVATLGHAHRGLDFWLENGVDTLKRYRLFADVASPDTRDVQSKLFVFGFLPWYAVTGYDIGVRYLLYIRQHLGLNRAQITDGIAMAFLVTGPAAMETVVRALEGFAWSSRSEPAPLPHGWAVEPDAFRSGLDFTTVTMSGDEMRLLERWYERVVGEVPPYVRFLGRHRPDLLKAYRARYETCLKVLPKQAMPMTLLHYDVIRGFDDGIRENTLLARAFGVSKELALDIIGSALIVGGSSAASIVERAAGDVFDTWDS